MASLAEVRTDLYDALNAASDDATTYRRRQVNYQFPCFVVGWPQQMDVRAAQGGVRDFVIDVAIEVEVTDEEAADEALEALIEVAVTALDGAQWDVQPVTDFAETITGDGRLVIGCRLPVAVY